MSYRWDSNIMDGESSRGGHSRGSWAPHGSHGPREFNGTIDDAKELCPRRKP